jgi:hypothetical protein
MITPEKTEIKIRDKVEHVVKDQYSKKPKPKKPELTKEQ